MYRTGKAPQGTWARFLQSQRHARGWSAQRAFEELHVGLGYKPKSRASYIKLEEGPRPPTLDQQAFLVDFYGAEPSEEPEPLEAPAPDLISALARQAAAIEAQTAVMAALVEELRLGRAQQMEATQAVFETLAVRDLDLGRGDRPSGSSHGPRAETPR